MSTSKPDSSVSIYKISCWANTWRGPIEYVYIGQTRGPLQDRLRRHFDDARRKAKGEPDVVFEGHGADTGEAKPSWWGGWSGLHAAMLRFGRRRCRIELLEVVPAYLADEAEGRWMGRLGTLRSPHGLNAVMAPNCGRLAESAKDLLHDPPPDVHWPEDMLPAARWILWGDEPPALLPRQWPRYQG